MTMQKYKALLKQNAFFYLLVLAVAFCLKLHYSRASSDDLVWILKPTAILVEHATGIGFEHEKNSGYVNREHRIIIAPSCAGVNFLIMAFCMSAFSSLHQPGLRRFKLFWISVCGISSYILTLAVNTARITAAIYLYKYAVSWGWFTSERIHRIEGIVVYFLCLMFFYWVIQNIMGVRKKINKTFCFSGRTGGIMLMPWFWYLSISLGVPLLNTAYLKNLSGFVEHSLVVLLVSLAVLMVIFAVQQYIQKTRADLESAPTEG